jgi:hypothetical protein
MRNILVALLGIPIILGLLLMTVGLGAYLATRCMKAFHLDRNVGGIIFSLVFIVGMLAGMWILRLLKQAI